MRLRSAFLALTLIPAAAFSIAAHVPEGCTNLDDRGTTDEPSDDVIACTSTSYFSCEKALDAGATGKVHNPLETVPLVFEAPETSFTAGAGCGEAEAAGVTGTAMNNIYDINVAGLVNGNVDTVTFALHSIYAAAQRVDGEMDLEVRFDIGGVAPNGTVDNEASGTGTVTTTPAPITFSVDPETSETGISESFTLSVTDLYEAFPELSQAGTGDDLFHQLNLTVSVAQSDHAGAWVWGAAEIPASVTLNAPAEQLGVEVSALDLAG